MPAVTHAEGSQLAAGSIEVWKLWDKRKDFYARLRMLRAAGLDAHSATALMWSRTAGDFAFLARACGVPRVDARKMDDELLAEIGVVLGDGSADKRALLSFDL